MEHLRVELNATCFYLFAYHHMDVAKFESADGRDTLTISFLAHSVRLVGANLRELAIALQTRSIESIRPALERYGALVGDGGSIESIEVEENSDQT